MSSTLRELAALVGGEVVGDGDTVVTAAVPLAEVAAGQITFIDRDKHLPVARSCAAVAIVVGPTTVLDGKPLLRVADPFAAFVQIVKHLHGRPELTPSGVDARAAVDPTAVIGPESSVAAFAFVGAGSVLGARSRLFAGAVVGADCIIGDDVTLHPHVVLYDGTIVGHRVTVHANSVLGADGFGYKLQNGRHVKVPQQGRVEIGDDVEIGACTTIDRGTFGATRIGAGTKIDNQAQIAHNCQLGRHNIVVAQVGMAGSCSTGDYVVLAGQSGVADHIHIGARAVIGAKAAVHKDVAVGERVLGIPAMPEHEARRVLMAQMALPEMRKTLRKVALKLGLEGEAA